MNCFPLLLLLVLTLAGISCSHVPSKYTKLDYSGAKGGYRVLSQKGGGAQIETYTEEYHFMPQSYVAAEKAQRHFLKAAQQIGSTQGQVVTGALINEADITRNPFKGTYHTVLSGVIKFGSGDPVLAATDISMLMTLAEASQEKSYNAMAMSGSIARGFSEATKEANRNNAVRSLDASIQSNTSAVNNLRREVRTGSTSYLY